VLGEEDGAGAALADGLEDPVGAEDEPLVLAQQQLLGLVGGEQAGPDQRRRAVVRVGRGPPGPGKCRANPAASNSSLLRNRSRNSSAGSEGILTPWWSR
jgi:hypothetical protein